MSLCPDNIGGSSHEEKLETTTQQESFNYERGVSLTINGGKNELDSATIPIQWWFDKKTIKKKPKYVLIIEQNEKESRSSANCKNGRRYLCEVTEGVKYLQIFSSGYHRLMVIVFDSSVKLSEIQRLIAKEKNIYTDLFYEYHLYFRAENDHEEITGLSLTDNKYISWAVTEFTVPEELFAKRPSTKTGGWIWNWANEWYKKDPIDECAYRKRKIFAFTLKPLLVLFFSVLKLTWFLIKNSMFWSIYGLMWLLYFFFGCRMVGPQDFKECFDGGIPGLKELLYIQQKYLEKSDGNTDWTKPVKKYKSWSIVKDKNGNERIRKMPFSPFELSVFTGVLMFFIFVLPKIDISISVADETLLMALLIIIGISVLFFIITMYVKNLFNFKINIKEYKKDRRLKKEQEKEKRIVLAVSAYENWLEKYMNRVQKTEIVDIRHLPPPPQKTERIIRAFRVAFWATKAKVCKPYAK